MTQNVISQIYNFFDTPKFFSLHIVMFFLIYRDQKDKVKQRRRVSDFAKLLKLTCHYPHWET